MSGDYKSFKEMSSDEKIAGVIILIIGIIIVFSVAFGGGDSNRGNRSDLEKENLQWSHEAYDYIHSGKAAKDMGY